MKISGLPPHYCMEAMDIQRIDFHEPEPSPILRKECLLASYKLEHNLEHELTLKVTQHSVINTLSHPLSYCLLSSL